MSTDLAATIATAAIELMKIAVKLFTGGLTEDEARAALVEQGLMISEGQSDGELAEYDRILR